MTEDAYENLKDNENSIQSEEYIYAYRLNGAMTQKQLKNKLKKITFNPDDVDDHILKITGKKLQERKMTSKTESKNLQMQVPRCQTD